VGPATNVVIEGPFIEGTEDLEKTYTEGSAVEIQSPSDSSISS
jgi:hypothetical protein